MASAKKRKEYHDGLPIKDFQLTEKQRQLLDVIENNTITFVKAPAGTGKSATALYYAAQNYLNNVGDQIIVVRTPVEATKDKVGFLPNDLEAKLEPHFASAKNLLEGFLGKPKVECDLGKRIHFKIPNFMLGSTFDNSTILIDECFTESHEILTVDGWKGVVEVTMDDLIYQHHPDGTGSFAKPLRVINKMYEGNFHSYQRAGVSYEVTAKHRLILSDEIGQLEEITADADKLPKDQYFITSSLYNLDATYPISTDEIRIAVAAQADGHMNKSGACIIAVKRKDKIQMLDELSKSLEMFQHRSYNEKYDIMRYSQGSFKSELVDSTPDKNFNLDVLLRLSVYQKRVFIEELAKWDGNRVDGKKSRRHLYYTINKHNADVAQIIGNLCGYSTYIYSNEYAEGKTLYTVSFRDTSLSPIQGYKEEIHRKTEYKAERVYCVTMPTGMVLVRHNGYAHVSGNCQELPPHTMKLILERIGKNTKVIVAGDPTQLYSHDRSRNGLTHALNVFFDDTGNARYPNIGFFEFGIDDIVRSDIVKTVVTAYSKYGKLF